VRFAAALIIVAAGVVAVILAMREAGTPTPGPSVAPAATATPVPARTPPPRRHRLARPRCPADVAGCASVRGRVVYVERVDPDGDGDLHVVVLAGRVTAPGATAIDVAKDLRPRRDPRVGDEVAAAGPVQTGHLGQSQIHALVFNSRR
jgi:hypothetical protein